jgi:hypothetical protein
LKALLLFGRVNATARHTHTCAHSSKPSKTRKKHLGEKKRAHFHHYIQCPKRDQTHATTYNEKHTYTHHTHTLSLSYTLSHIHIYIPRVFGTLTHSHSYTHSLTHTIQQSKTITTHHSFQVLCGRELRIHGTQLPAHPLIQRCHRERVHADPPKKRHQSIDRTSLTAWNSPNMGDNIEAQRTAKE